ncbi:MAG: dihydrodipicolinate synthase family protein [Clostridiales bacterium]|nr:dihydrodipicolinate synthase family protein [Clostridiales bacterium]
MKDIQEIRGVIPAMMTCFDENGAFDEARQRGLTEFLVNKGVDALYLTGSTGEAFLMDASERCAVVEAVIDQVNGRIPLIVHVGDIGTQKSIRLAEHAYKAGADAISSVPPFYFRFSEDEIFSYYEALSNATPLPMIIYNIALAGTVSTDCVKRLAALPNVKGMKYTLPTHHEIMRLKRELGSSFMIYSGCDEMAMSGFAFGSDGIIGSFYNVIPEIFLQLAQAVKANDLARTAECQRVADAIILFVLEFPYFSAMKKMLQWMGHDFGYVRAPFARLDSSQEQRLLDGLKAIRAQYGTHGLEALEALPEKI